MAVTIFSGARLENMAFSFAGNKTALIFQDKTNGSVEY
jgi:hypothetical protein